MHLSKKYRGRLKFNESNKNSKLGSYTQHVNFLDACASLNSGQGQTSKKKDDHSRCPSVDDLSDMKQDKMLKELLITIIMCVSGFRLPIFVNTFLCAAQQTII